MFDVENNFYECINPDEEDDKDKESGE